MIRRIGIIISLLILLQFSLYSQNNGKTNHKMYVPKKYFTEHYFNNISCHHNNFFSHIPLSLV